MKKLPLPLMVAAILAVGIPLSLGAPGRTQSEAESVAEMFLPRDVDASGERIKLNLPENISAVLIGTTYEQIIDFDGKVRHPISPKTTKLTFQLTDPQGNKGWTRILEVAVPAQEAEVLPSGRNAKPGVVPALQEWLGGPSGTEFEPGENFRVVIPPQGGGDALLRKRAELFATELSELLGREIKVIESADGLELKDCVAIAIENGEDTKFLGKEGYILSCSESSITIRAHDSLGAFWGTRTILQVFTERDNVFPCGLAIDYPQYGLRGFSYDAGRKPTTLEALRNIMKTMSYYKMNDFQIHLNDNFILLDKYAVSSSEKYASHEEKVVACREVLDAAPTAFRLESSVTGLNGVPLTAQDFFYTKADFSALIDDAEVHGVTIVPEIDVPGHALSLVRVRPELMYHGDVLKPHDVERTAMLDASEDIFDPARGTTYREATLDYVQGIFEEYLVGQRGEPPVFRNTPVHIGTDEYYGNAEDYRAFADAMIKYVKSRGRTPRLWGSFSLKRGQTPVETEGVQLDVWSHEWQNPQEALNLGFDIINILDATGYIVPNGTGNVGGYGDYLNLPLLYSQKWQPNIIGPTTVVAGYPQLLGASWALWNDNSFRDDTGLVDFDLYNRIRATSAVIAEKTWNTGEDGNYDDFVRKLLDVGLPPLTNPEYEVQSEGDVLFAQEFEKLAPRYDLSGNGNNAVDMQNVGWTPGHFGMAMELRGGASFMKTPIEGIAPDYIAEFWVNRSAESKDDVPQVLFSSHLGKIMAVQKDTGKVGITRDTWDYSFDYTLPVGRWVELTLVARGRDVTLYVNGKRVNGPARNKFPETHKYSTFVFPLEYIGSKENSFVGQIDSLKITRLNSIGASRLVPSDEIVAVRASSEHGIGTDGDASKLMDGNQATYWHSKYNPKDNPPFEITIEFARPQTLDAFAFLPRQNHDNGNVLKAKLFAKLGDSEWKKLAEFKDESRSRDLKKIDFAKQDVDALKFVITESVNNFGTIAEIFPLRAPRTASGANTPLAQDFDTAQAILAAADTPSAKLAATLEEVKPDAEDPDCAPALQDDLSRTISEALQATE